MAREVSSVRPARPGVRVQDLDRPSLIRLALLLKEAIEDDYWQAEAEGASISSWAEEANQLLT